MSLETKIVIPNYEADDFFTSEPFEWLYKHKDNKFMMAQAVEAMKIKAGSVGVKSFITLWKAYLESVAGKNRLMPDNSTSFDRQEIELMSGDWICDECGVFTFDKIGFEVSACNHPIMPVLRLVNIDTETEKIKLAYRYSGKPWRYIIVDKSTIASTSSIVSLSSNGIAVTSENAKYLVRYLSDVESYNIDILPEQKSIGRLGWAGEYGFSPYVDDLIFDGESNFKRFFNSVKIHGDFYCWLDIVKSIRKNGIIARIMLAASFSSVLLKPLNALPFFVHTWGGTEAGKTVGLMLAASVWANPDMNDNYIKTFNSTAVGLEMSAGFVNSLPLCLDELQIKTNRSEFDTLIYQLCEGVGRIRGAKTGGVQKMSTWQCCILTTGEMPITSTNSSGGAVNRIIEIDCKSEKLFSDPIGVVDVLKKNYGYAGKLFIEFLKKEENIEKAKLLQKKIHSEISNTDITDKQTISASILLTADRLIDEWIFQDDQTIDVADILPYLTSKKDVSANDRALQFIFDTVAGNPNKFKSNKYGDYSGEVWGMTDEDHIYIIKSTFDRIVQSEGYSPTAFLSWAKNKGYLECRHHRTTMMKRVDGSNCSCVCVKKSAQETEDNAENVENTGFQDVFSFSELPFEQ